MSWLRRIPIFRRIVYMRPTKKDVEEFYSYMTHEYHTKVVNKQDAPEMQAAAFVLNMMGIVNTKDFLAHYATTIGDTIYVPFEIGVPKAGWDLWMQMIGLVHEHMHIVQRRRSNLGQFEWDYLTDHSARMTYEVEAYRVNMELGWRYQRKFPSPSTIANWLKSYGCTSVDIQNAMPALEMMAKKAKNGEIISEVSRVAIKKLDPKFYHG